MGLPIKWLSYAQIHTKKDRRSFYAIKLLFYAQIHEKKDGWSFLWNWIIIYCTNRCKKNDGPERNIIITKEYLTKKIQNGGPFSLQVNPFCMPVLYTFSVPVLCTRFVYPFCIPVFYIRFVYPFCIQNGYTKVNQYTRFVYPFSIPVLYTRFVHPPVLGKADLVPESLVAKLARERSFPVVRSAGKVQENPLFLKGINDTL